MEDHQWNCVMFPEHYNIRSKKVETSSSLDICILPNLASWQFWQWSCKTSMSSSWTREGNWISGFPPERKGVGNLCWGGPHCTSGSIRQPSSQNLILWWSNFLSWKWNILRRHTHWVDIWSQIQPFLSKNRLTFFIHPPKEAKIVGEPETGVMFTTKHF